jgi:hypothetical protein
MVHPACSLLPEAGDGRRGCHVGGRTIRLAQYFPFPYIRSVPRILFQTNTKVTYEVGAKIQLSHRLKRGFRCSEHRWTRLLCSPRTLIATGGLHELDQISANYLTREQRNGIVFASEGQKQDVRRIGWRSRVYISEVLVYHIETRLNRVVQLQTACIPHEALPKHVGPGICAIERRRNLRGHCFRQRRYRGWASLRWAAVESVVAEFQVVFGFEISEGE